MNKKIVLSSVLMLSLSTAAFAKVVDRIVAVVNNEIILESDFTDLVEKTKNSTLIDETILSTDLSTLQKSHQAQQDYLIAEKIIDSEIKKLNLTVTSERVQQEIKDMAKRNRVSPEEIIREVKKQGLSESDYQNFLKVKIERQNLIESEIISKLRINDDDALSEYLKRNPKAKANVNEFSVSHIFFNPQKGGPQEAYDRASKVLLKLHSGATFEKLAEEYSEDPNFTQGGFLGNFKSGEFLKEIEESIQNLSPGQMTDVVKSRMGYHIVKLVSKKVTTDTQFEKEKQRIISELMESNFKRQFKIWLQSKKDESFIRINKVP